MGAERAHRIYTDRGRTVWRGTALPLGHPLLDQPAFLGRVRPAWLAEVTKHWEHEWQFAIPGSDPGRASALIAPIAAARQAVIYQLFLDNIEPSERVYHADDPALWLRRTAALLPLLDDRLLGHWQHAGFRSQHH